MSSRGGPPQIKNRAPAPIQITAEQILREAKERKLEEAPRAPKQYITDSEELRLYQQNKRKDFEDQIRRQRQHIGTWMKYGLWEASQKEFERARSVFERGLDVDYRHQALWLKYAEMEMKNKFINHARNVWDRAVTLHPRVDMFWYKYAYMEEMVGAVENARQVFERWMKWEPDDMGWGAYIKFEMRQEQIGRARGLFERYIACHPTCRAYLKYAKWEEKLHEKVLARTIYERSVEELHPQERTEKLLINFARFEERCKEFERARVIFKFALTQLSKETAPELYTEYLAFEKKHGTRQGIEDAILNKRRQQYEDRLSEDPYDYDTWFDFCRLEQDEGDFDRIREIYDRAVTQSPPILDKKYWRRYIYLWIYYAVWEELKAKDMARARSVYKRCLDLIPHKKFTFGKVWVMAAQLEVRTKDLTAARRLLGQGIGMCGKENIFKGYIHLELQLGEVDRCRTIYVKYLETMPFNCTAWKEFAALESNVGETLRARAVYELAVSQPELDMPEALWKAYIDFEMKTTLAILQDYQQLLTKTDSNTNTAVDAEGDDSLEEVKESFKDGVGKIRSLFERLLDKTSHVKVWISYGQSEASWLTVKDCPLPASDILDRVRGAFKRGYEKLKSQGLKEERVMLLQAWREIEANAGELGDTKDVESRMPRKVKMKRAVPSEEGAGDGSGSVIEEYFDYSFPDDEKPIVGIKILENALKWKQMMQAAASSIPSSSSEDTSDTPPSEAGATGGAEEGEAAAVASKKRKAEEEIDIDDI